MKDKIKNMPVLYCYTVYLTVYTCQVNLLNIKPQIVYLQSLSTALGVSPSFLTLLCPAKAVPRQRTSGPGLVAALADWSSEALELRKWAVLGQINGNHTSSQLTLPQGGRETKARREGVCAEEEEEVVVRGVWGEWVYTQPPWEQKNA